MLNGKMISELDPSQQGICEKMHGVFQHSYQKEAELIGCADFPPLRRTLGDLRTSKCKFFGYWKKSQIAAVVEVLPKPGLLKIRSLVVDPQFFREGIGSHLLTHILDLFTFESAVVETAMANTPAISLYQKLGFIEEKQWQTSHGIKKIKLHYMEANNS